jgi:hypothetical protein
MSEVHSSVTSHPVRVFISHASSDQVYARKLRNLLVQRASENVFLTEDLNAGGKWQDKLRDALSRADVVVAILTPASVHSSWVLHEIGAAWALGKPIIPVVSRRDVLNHIPISLENIQAIHLQEVESPANADKFLSSFENSLMAAHIV